MSDRCPSGYLCFEFFTLAHEDNFHLYRRSRAICEQLLNNGGKLARIHHMMAEFTECSGCLPSILIVDNCILFTFRWQVRLCSSSFRPVPISIFISATDTGNTNGPEMDKSTARAHVDFFINTRLFLINTCSLIAYDTGIYAISLIQASIGEICYDIEHRKKKT